MIRPATEADASALERLGTEAFGHPPRQSPAPVNAPGRHTLLADAGTEADADPVGCVVTLDFESWFWGRRVPTAGVASVKIATEHRGEGLLRPLLTRALQERHAEGAVLSTLFPTAPGIYRSLGYEVFADYAERTVLPTAHLTRVRPGGASVRRATVADVPNLREVYHDWARAHNGPLTRDGARFPFTDAELVAAFTGVSVAEQDGRYTGYALWNRTGGYRDEGILEVADLVCLTPEATRSLLRALGTHEAVAPRTVLATSHPDTVLDELPNRRLTLELTHPYGLAVLDVIGAFDGLPVPAEVTGELTFTVSGLPLPGQDGGYRLRIADGSISAQRVGGSPPSASMESSSETTHFEARGLALRFAGARSNSDLRRAGLLSGDDSRDSLWDLVLSGRAGHIRDYF